MGSMRPGHSEKRQRMGGHLCRPWSLVTMVSEGERNCCYKVQSRKRKSASSPGVWEELWGAEAGPAGPEWPPLGQREWAHTDTSTRWGPGSTHPLHRQSQGGRAAQPLLVGHCEAEEVGTHLQPGDSGHSPAHVLHLQCSGASVENTGRAGLPGSVWPCACLESLKVTLCPRYSPVQPVLDSRLHPGEGACSWTFILTSCQ